jgi:superfamily II DNA or RNA helicase
MSDVICSFLSNITQKVEAKSPEIWSKKVLSNFCTDKLLEYQTANVLKDINTILKKNVCLGASDTGVGKTYMALAVCKELGKRPIIVSPKMIMPNWIDICEYFEIEPYDIVNFETIRNCKTYKNYNFLARVKSPYIKAAKKNSVFDYIWFDIPDDAILIIDEAHRCRNPTTDNGKWLLSTKQLILKKIPVMMLSATICEKIKDMKILFYLFDIIPTPRAYMSYIKSLKYKYPEHKVDKKDYPDVIEFEKAKANSTSIIIYKEIRDYVSRIKISELGSRFPSNQWCAQQFIAEETDEIAVAYEEIAECMAELKKNPGGNHLARIIKLKQEIELRKVPIFIEQAQLYLDEGKSVIIFVNYLDTLRLLVDALGIECIISGEYSLQEKNRAVELFQTNQKKIIICQIRAGGVGISLHDIYGGHPRVSLINYPDSASDLLQALGRAPRAGAKTPVLQRIIFVANVEYERVIMQNINRKLTNISAINDGDLVGYSYKVKKISRRKKIN